MIDHEGALTAHPGRCTTSYVQIVGRKPRYPSNPMVKGPYTAGIVTRNIDRNGIKRYIERDRTRLLVGPDFVRS